MAIIINIIWDLVNFCQSLVDHMAILNYGDSLLHMSTGTGTGSGYNLQGNSGIPNGSSNGGNPGGLPGGKTIRVWRF